MIGGCSNNHMLIAHRLTRQPLPQPLNFDENGEQLQDFSAPIAVTGLITMEGADDCICCACSLVSDTKYAASRLLMYTVQRCTILC